MTSITFFFIFIPLLAFILLAINLLFAPHNPYQEKDSAFECGFHSFLGQNRTQFSISFFIFALLFLLFDLEILLVYPYVVSAYANGIYGLIVMLIFFLVLTLGFAFELGKNALKIDSRQMYSVWNKVTIILSYTSSQKNLFNLYSLSYINVFKLACWTFIYNLSSRVIVLNIAIRFIFLIIFCFWVIYLDWSILELWLVRILILQIIIAWGFFFFNEKIVFFIDNCTVKDLVYITIFSLIWFSVMLTFFSLFITISNHIFELAIVLLTPGLNGSRVLMDISKLLNPTTPPASTGNNPVGGSGGGGGGSPVDSGIPALAGHGTNNSDDNTTEHNVAPSHPSSDFFDQPFTRRSAKIGGKEYKLFYYNSWAEKFQPLLTNRVHHKPLEIFWTTDGYHFLLLDTDPARPMPNIGNLEHTFDPKYQYNRLCVNEVSNKPELGKWPYNPSNYRDSGKIIYYKTEHGYEQTPYVVPVHKSLALSGYNLINRALC